MLEKTQLVYDGDCGLCRALVNQVERFDTNGRITCLASDTCQWPDAEIQPFSSTVVVRSPDGTTHMASTAVALTLSDLDGVLRLLGRWVLFLNRSSLLRSHHDWWYYAVARRRVAISNGLVRINLLDQSCRISKQ